MKVFRHAFSSTRWRWTISAASECLPHWRSRVLEIHHQQVFADSLGFGYATADLRPGGLISTTRSTQAGCVRFSPVKSGRESHSLAVGLEDQEAAGEREVAGEARALWRWASFHQPEPALLARLQATSVHAGLLPSSGAGGRRSVTWMKPFLFVSPMLTKAASIACRDVFRTCRDRTITDLVTPWATTSSSTRSSLSTAAMRQLLPQ